MKGGQLDAERGRLGMDTMAAPDGRGQLVFEGPLFEGREHAVDAGQQQISGAHHLHVQAGVEHVG